MLAFRHPLQLTKSPFLQLLTSLTLSILQYQILLISHES